MSNEYLQIRRITTDQLSQSAISEVRELMRVAFAKDEHGGFSDEDWQHSIGGVHFVLDVDGRIVSHASVVERLINVAGLPLTTGYVEAVATAPGAQRRGYGTAVMREVNDHVAARFELGALGTGSQPFYERLGWQIWRGPSFVRLPDGREQPTPDEDGYIMVLLTPASPVLDMSAPIICEWRPGDVW